VRRQAHVYALLVAARNEQALRCRPLGETGSLLPSALLARQRLCCGSPPSKQRTSPLPRHHTTYRAVVKRYHNLLLRRYAVRGLVCMRTTHYGIHLTLPRLPAVTLLLPSAGRIAQGENAVYTVFDLPILPITCVAVFLDADRAGDSGVSLTVLRIMPALKSVVLWRGDVPGDALFTPVVVLLFFPHDFCLFRNCRSTLRAWVPGRPLFVRWHSPGDSGSNAYRHLPVTSIADGSGVRCGSFWF